MDSAGNVAVTGPSESALQNPDYYTAKYAAANGALLWEKRYNGPANKEDFPYSVAVDGTGNVFVTGYSQNASGDTDYYTAKYAAANGALLWEKRYNSLGNGYEYALAVKVDSAGNAVVTGTSENASGNDDYYTAKYAAADGELLWEKRYNGPASRHDRMDLVYPFNLGCKLAFTAEGGAVVTGASDANSSGGNNYDYATVRYRPSPDADGDGLLDSWELLWWATTTGHAAGDDSAHDGLNELQELAFGLNPTVPDVASQPAAINEGGYLTITITKYPGAAYEVQSAGDVNAASFSAAATTVLVNSATTLKVRDNILVSTPPARYLRVKVTAAP